MIFWWFKLTCAIEPTAFFLPFMLLILLSRPSYFILSVFLSMVLHHGDCRLPLEVTFNNLLRKFSKLLRQCHTSILHNTSSLWSLFNVVVFRSSKLCQKARDNGIPLILHPQLSYTTFALMLLIAMYTGEPTPMPIKCALTLWDDKLFPQVNRGLSDEVYYMCTC